MQLGFSGLEKYSIFYMVKIDFLKPSQSESPLVYQT